MCYLPTLQRYSCCFHLPVGFCKKNFFPLGGKSDIARSRHAPFAFHFTLGRMGVNENLANLGFSQGTTGVHSNRTGIQSVFVKYWR